MTNIRISALKWDIFLTFCQFKTARILNWSKCFLGVTHMIQVENCLKMTNSGSYLTSVRLKYTKSSVLCKNRWKKIITFTQIVEKLCVYARVRQCHLSYLKERTFAVILHRKSALGNFWKIYKCGRTVVDIQIFLTATQ